MRFDHINIAPKDVEAMKDFLIDVLELEIGRRPPFQFPGYWLYNDEGQAVVHMQQWGEGMGPVGGYTEPQSPTIFHHISWGPFDFDAKTKALEAVGRPFRTNVVPGSTLRQIFVDGPEGIMLELQCPGGKG